MKTRADAFHQYREMKARNPGVVILVRMGTLYAAYGADATTISEVLGLTRTKHDGTSVTRFQCRSLGKYLGKLLTAGHRVGILERAEAEGKFPRITRIVTPRG